MGIEGLNPFLKKESPDNYVEIPYSYFNGKRIIIDSDNVFRRFMSTAHRDVVNSTDLAHCEPDRSKTVKAWLERLTGFVTEMLKAGITPIFVYDGDHPDEKGPTQHKRRERRNTIIARYQELKDKIYAKDELSKTAQDTTELRKLLVQLSSVSRDEMKTAIDILSAVGIPCIRAMGEGEELCAMLCREGKVAACFSQDTDLLAYGTPMSITEYGKYQYNIKSRRSEPHFVVTIYKGILNNLGFDYNTFRDFCIMCGCDYNSRIYRVGPATAFKLLTQCRNIENLPEKYTSKAEVLNVDFCRRMFSYRPSHEVASGHVILNIDRDVLMHARDLLEQYDLGEWLINLVGLYKTLPDPHQGPYIMSSVEPVVSLNIVGPGALEDHGLNEVIDELEDGPTEADMIDDFQNGLPQGFQQEREQEGPVQPVQPGQPGQLKQSDHVNIEIINIC